MIELDRHIEILLLSNDCVIVPDLGGFTAHHIDARYDEQDGMFVPPIRTLGFNPQLKMNDSLLVQSYIEAYDISYPEALRRIEGEVVELRSHLENEGSFELNGIGVLSLNEEGKLEFDPCEAGILTPELYGLSSFSMAPLVKQELALRPVKAEQQIPDENVITIKMSWLRNAVAVAAAIITFLMMSTPVSNSNKMADVQQSAFITVPTSHKTTQAPEAPLLSSEANSDVVISGDQSIVPSEQEDLLNDEVPSSIEDVVDGPSFCIVMASQVTEHNAQLFISQLADKGFNDAHILMSGKMRRVVYGSFATEADAVSTLQQLRKESRVFRETWIMEVK